MRTKVISGGAGICEWQNRYPSGQDEPTNPLLEGGLIQCASPPF